MLKPVTSTPEFPIIYDVPALDEQTATVIFLHGRGDTGIGWSRIWEGAVRLPHVKVYLPQAPTRYLSRYHAEMPAWYECPDISWDHSYEDVNHFEETRQIISKIIKYENENGIPTNRIVLAGYSQGASMALFTGLTYDVPLGGIVAMSGYLPQHTLVPEECKANRSTPVFIGCGDADEVIPYQGLMKESADFLQEFQEGTELHVYQGLGHCYSKKEFDDVKAFLEKVIPE